MCIDLHSMWIWKQKPTFSKIHFYGPTLLYKKSCVRQSGNWLKENRNFIHLFTRRQSVVSSIWWQLLLLDITSPPPPPAARFSAKIVQCWFFFSPNVCLLLQIAYLCRRKLISFATDSLLKVNHFWNVKQCKIVANYCSRFMFECIKHHFHFKLELNGLKLNALGIGSDENISCADFYGLQIWWKICYFNRGKMQCLNIFLKKLPNKATGNLVLLYCKN